MRAITTAVALVVCATPLAVVEAASPTVIDLTHSFDANTIYWPTEPGFDLKKLDDGYTERGYYYAANRYDAPEHGGTHIDAPHHFSKPGQTVDQIPLDRLVGEAVCVDITTPCAVDPDYLVTIDDFKQWEKATGASLAEKIVLLKTGYAEHWPDRQKYLGTAEMGPTAVAKLHFPGLDPAAASWLCSARRIKAVGIDTASIDNGPSQMFQSHVNLFEHETPALENVASMKDLPATGFRLFALPMKIAGGSGAPCRIVAVIEE